MRTFSVVVRPPDFVHARRVERALRGAATALGVATRLRSVELVLRPRLAGDEAHVRWREGGRKLDVRIDVDLGNFLTPNARLGYRRRGPSRRSRDPFPARRWSEKSARATFLHELTHVADALRLGIDATRVSARRRGPFNEVWNVWIDGRLARRGGAALSRLERLREFRRAIGRYGRAHADALPTFNRLWQARRLSQRDLVDVVERLVG